MEIIPAIDLLQNKAVRLYKGDYNQVTVYSDAPWEVAQEFLSQGASRLHIVDLEGARDGRPGNLETLQKIRKLSSVPIQLGGGIRNLESLAMYDSLGIDRFILGTSAVTNPNFLEKSLETYGKDRIVVAVDSKDGYVRIAGWTGNSQIHYKDFLPQLESYGVQRILFTDISLDGTLQGPNVELYQWILDHYPFYLIASGGISSLEDIEKLQSLRNPKLEGVIVGKALYEKKFQIKDALAILNH